MQNDAAPALQTQHNVQNTVQRLQWTHVATALLSLMCLAVFLQFVQVVSGIRADAQLRQERAQQRVVALSQCEVRGDYLRRHACKADVLGVDKLAYLRELNAGMGPFAASAEGLQRVAMASTQR